MASFLNALRCKSAGRRRFLPDCHSRSVSSSRKLAIIPSILLPPDTTLTRYYCITLAPRKNAAKLRMWIAGRAAQVYFLGLKRPLNREFLHRANPSAFNIQLEKSTTQSPRLWIFPQRSFRNTSPLPRFLRFLRATAPKPDPAVAAVTLIRQSPAPCASPWGQTRAPRVPHRPGADAQSSAQGR